MAFARHDNKLLVLTGGQTVQLACQLRRCLIVFAARQDQQWSAISRQRVGVTDSSEPGIDIECDKRLGIPGDQRVRSFTDTGSGAFRSDEHTSELQSRMRI